MAVIAALTGCDRVYEFPSEPSVKLTEATAIEVSHDGTKGVPGLGPSDRPDVPIKALPSGQV
jgi:hypothetical protein